jgi:hypothetical protein
LKIVCIFKERNMKTRKKFSLWITGIGLLLILMLSGCQDMVSDYTLTEKGISIQGPAGLKAEKLTGGVLLSWQTVPDAKGYQVYRYDKATGEEKELTGNESILRLYYLDLVSWTNPLAAGSYTYKVVAVSGGSGNDRSIAAEALVFNGVSSTDVTFAATDIPARTDSSWITLAALPDPEDGPEGAKRLVFPATPNLSYTARIALGGALEGATGATYYYLDDDCWSKTVSGAPFVKERYVDLPEVGGTTTIEITAIYASDYYQGTAVQRKAVTQEVGGLAQPEFEEVSRRTGESQYVDFSWENVSGATAYKVYKAEVDTASEAGLTLKSGWQLVVFSVAPSSYQQDGTHYWRAVENDAAGVGKQYAYILVAENGTKKSLSSELKFLEVASTSAPSLSATVVYDPAAAAVTPQIQLAWTAAPSTTYALSRAAVTFLNDDEDSASLQHIVSAAAFSPVTLTAADYLQGKGVKIDTAVTARQTYVYKLVATKNGVDSLPAYAVVNEGPFSYKSYLSASQYSGTPAYYGIALALEDDGTYWDDNPVIRIYRKKAYEPQTAYVYLTGKDITADKKDEVFVDDISQLTADTYYEYKFVVVKDGKEFDNYDSYYDGYNYVYYSHPATVTAQVQIPSVNSINFASTSTSATASAITLRFYGSSLEGAPIRVRYQRDDATTWTTVSGTITYNYHEDLGYGIYEYSIRNLTPQENYNFSAIKGAWLGTSPNDDNFHAYAVGYSGSDYDDEDPIVVATASAP